MTQLGQAPTEYDFSRRGANPLARARVNTAGAMRCAQCGDSAIEAKSDKWESKSRGNILLVFGVSRVTG
jgi:hypothetical protein